MYISNLKDFFIFKQSVFKISTNRQKIWKKKTKKKTIKVLKTLDSEPLFTKLRSPVGRHAEIVGDALVGLLSIRVWMNDVDCIWKRNICAQETWYHSRRPKRERALSCEMSF